MSNRALFWLLLPVAAVFILLLAGIFGMVLAMLPPWVSGVSLSVLGLIAVWFVFARRANNVGGTEGSLMGRQKSKEGLL